ncbi:MAG: DNA polymerase III subunit beta [Lachnospiraceae bacterium]|nr:DNA polymerase III subunit beta [Lachnospiraceae bacterium]
MKIKITQKDLLKGLTTVTRAVNQKSTQAILGCVLIDVGENITLMGNNLEIGIQTVLEGDIEGQGKVAVDAKILTDMIRKMPEGDITIESKENEVTIKGGKAKFKVSSRNADEYPALPDVGDGVHFAVDGMIFKDMVKQIAFAAAENSSNKAMEGINLVLKEQILSMTALDGVRVAIRHVVVDDSKEMTTIVPGKTMREMAGIIEDDKVHFYFADKHLMALFGNTTVVSRLIVGNYFDINKILGIDFSIKVKVDRKAFYDCVDRSTLFTKDVEKKPVIMAVYDNSVNLGITTSQGSMNEDIEAVVEGSELRIGFNAKYMLDALAAIEDDTVIIRMKDPKSPICIKDDEDIYLYIVLPTAIQEGI